MNLIKRYYLNYLIKKDEDFLLKEGLKKARENGLELCLCQNPLCSENKGEIHLPSYEGKIDVTNLLSIVADDYSEVTERYLANKEELSRLVPMPSSKT